MVRSRYIITGGPGAGKTTLLEALRRMGYAGSDEVSRRTILNERSKDPHCRPWKDLSRFAGQVLDGMIAAYRATGDGCPTFFDRGIPDIVAYLEAAALPVADKYRQALRQYPYAQTVFLLPPWEDIYVQDNARWQTFPESRILYQQIRAGYAAAGYDLVELPKAPVEERAAFIQEELTQGKITQGKIIQKKPWS